MSEEENRKDLDSRCKLGVYGIGADPLGLARPVGRAPRDLARISHEGEAHRPIVPANGLLLKDKSRQGDRHGADRV